MNYLVYVLRMSFRLWFKGYPYFRILAPCDNPGIIIVRIGKHVWQRNTMPLQCSQYTHQIPVTKRSFAWWKVGRAHVVQCLVFCMVKYHVITLLWWCLYMCVLVPEIRQSEGHQHRRSNCWRRESTPYLVSSVGAHPQNGEEHVKAHIEITVVWLIGEIVHIVVCQREH